MPAQFATIADVKSYLAITKTAQDAFIQSLLDSHAAIIEGYTARSFTPNPALVQAAASTVAAASAVGVGQITLASGAGVSAGQWLQVTTAAGSVDTLQVSGVVGSVLQLSGPLDHSHAVGDTAVAFADSAPPVSLTLTAGYQRDIRLPDAREIDTATLDGQALTTSGFTLVGAKTLTAIGTAGYTVSGGTATDLRLTPLGPVTQGWVPTLGNSLVVTGRFGMWPIPPDLKDACLLMTARAYKEKDAAYGDIVQLNDGSSVNYYRQMPMRAAMILDRYRIQALA